LNSTEDYGLSYYITPALYFSTLKEKTLLPLDLVYVEIDDYGQMETVTSVARNWDSHVIAARVYNEEDYNALREWIKESKENRIVYFEVEPGARIADA